MCVVQLFTISQFSFVCVCVCSTTIYNQSVFFCLLVSVCVVQLFVISQFSFVYILGCLFRAVDVLNGVGVCVCSRVCVRMRACAFVREHLVQWLWCCGRVLLKMHLFWYFAHRLACLLCLCLVVWVLLGKTAVAMVLLTELQCRIFYMRR